MKRSREAETSSTRAARRGAALARVAARSRRDAAGRAAPGRGRERRIRRVDRAPPPLGEPRDEIASSDTRGERPRGSRRAVRRRSRPDGPRPPNVSGEVARATGPAAEPRFEHGRREALAQRAAQRRHGRRNDSGDLRVGEERNGGEIQFPAGRAPAPSTATSSPSPLRRPSRRARGAGSRAPRLRVSPTRSRGKARRRRERRAEQAPFALVGLQDAEPVEDRRGVPEREEDGGRADPEPVKR